MNLLARILTISTVAPLAAIAGPLDQPKKSDGYVSPLSAPAKTVGTRPERSVAATIPIPAGETRRIKGDIVGRTTEGVFVKITNDFMEDQNAIYRAKEQPILAKNPRAVLPPRALVRHGEVVYITPFRDGFARSVDVTGEAVTAPQKFESNEVRAFTKK